jgi:putative transferase (TIGR04331 family)
MTDKPRFLITTADERTWKFDRAVLFLGEWCRRYDKREIWASMDAVVAMPYGVGEGQKDKDYEYFIGTSEVLLMELKDVLNEYHKTDHSLRYWRIVLGHWLHRYTSVIFNRWFTIQQALHNYRISGTTILDVASYSLATPDSISFIWACNDNVWNHVLYSRILRRFASIDLETDANSLGNMLGFREKNESIYRGRQFKQPLRKTIAGILQMLSRNNDAFIIDSYLPRKEEIRLQLSLGQMPQLWRLPKLAITEPDISLREKIALNAPGYQGFDQFVRALLLEILPTCYLEGYSALQDQVDRLPWPKTPKFIFTSGNFDTDEVFKAWTAQNVENGVPYYTGQHGANYGTAKKADSYAADETQLIETSDKFLTWGWTDGNSKHSPAFVFKTAGRKPLKHDVDGGLLLIEVCLLHRTQTFDQYPKFKIYQEQQFRFVQTLPERIHRKLIVRLHAEYKKQPWCEEQRWHDHSPATRLENGSQNIRDLISKSRLVVHSYDSTGMLETLPQNIPTLCFWHDGLSHLRESAKPYYIKLRQAGILQDSAELAARKVAEVWDDVPAWWNSDAVQSARGLFCDRYARVSSRPIKQLKQILLSR